LTDTTRETPDGRNLQLEKATVHFFLAEEPTIDADSVNRQHISFEVESLGPVIALLEARGEPYELGQYSGFKSRNYRWCEWRDPAGIRIECVERMEA
jgi:catechol 2,3-dioxygenase-like lactoylglutathione lyase family enzyme